MIVWSLLTWQAVSPPNTMQVSSFPAPMPTAAAVAAAAVTAKITAMDAVVPVSISAARDASLIFHYCYLDFSLWHGIDQV